MDKWKVVFVLVIGAIFSIRAAEELQDDINRPNGRRFLMVENAWKSVTGFLAGLIGLKAPEPTEQELEENAGQDSGSDSER